jgi:hypothetical protein
VRCKASSLAIVGQAGGGLPPPRGRPSVADRLLVARASLGHRG